MDGLFKVLPILIGLMILGCSTETIVTRVEEDICPVTTEVVKADTIVVYEADTTQRLYPIEFTATVNKWN